MMVQEEVLRVLKYGELERVGSSQPTRVNVRWYARCQSPGDVSMKALFALFSTADFFDVYGCRPCAAKAVLC